MQNIFLRVQALLRGKLARAGLGLFAANIAAGGLGYIYQIVMGRLMTTEDYGGFSAMMGVFTVIGTPVATLAMLISRRVSEQKATADYKAAGNFFASTNLKTLLLGGLFFVVWCLLSPWLQPALRAQSLIQVQLLGLLVFLSFLPAINNSFIQGLQLFTFLSASSVLGVFLKLIFSGFFVKMGLGISGALLGGVLSLLTLYVFTVYVIYPILKPQFFNREALKWSSKFEWKPVVPVFFAHLGFAAITQLDVVMVNHFFSSTDAGFFSVASVLGKAVLYLPGGVAMALFPLVAEKKAQGESTLSLLFQALAGVALLSGAAAVFYYLTSDFLVAALYGARYQNSAFLLKLYGFTVLPMSLVVIIKYYMIALGRTSFAYMFLPVAILQYITIYFYHPSLPAVLAVMAGFGFLLASIGLMQILLAFLRKNS